MPRFSSRQIASRDPAMAALMGAMPASFGADFGNDDRLGDAMGSRSFANRDLRAGAYGSAEMLDVDAGQLRHDNSVIETLESYRHHDLIMRKLEQERAMDPNRGLATKIGRYDFSVTTPLVIGDASGFSTSKQPQTRIRSKRLFCNVPCPQFVTISALLIANINVFIGGPSDAATYAPTALDSLIDLPTLSPQNQMTVDGTYSGIAPAPYGEGLTYNFIATVQGSAHLYPEMDV
jgi:hypothetical protein